MEGRVTSIYNNGWNDMDKPDCVYQPPDNIFNKPCTLDIATRHMMTHREAAARDLKRQNTVTAKSALEYYNNRHSSRFELVDAVSSSGHLQSDGIWYHCNFKAKSEDSSSTKLFFAEMTVIRSNENRSKYMVTSCRPLEGTRGVSGCYMCSKDSTIIHPTRGFRKGLYALKRRSLRPRPRTGRL